MILTKEQIANIKGILQSQYPMTDIVEHKKAIKTLLNYVKASDSLLEEACEYMVHKPGCLFSLNEGNERSCTCGYIDLDNRMSGFIATYKKEE